MGLKRYLKRVEGTDVETKLVERVFAGKRRCYDSWLMKV